MLISQIVQLDAQSNEFAKKHAASEIGRSDGGESFADYLAATMNPNQSRREAGEIEADASPRDRTPVEAYRQDVGAKKASDDRAGRDASVHDTEKVPDKADRTKDTTEDAPRQEKAKPEDAVVVPEKDRAEKVIHTGKIKAELGAESSRGVPAEAVSATDHRVDEGTEQNTATVTSSRKDTDVAGRAGRVSSRRVSEGKVEIDVRVDGEKTAITETKDSASAKKSAEVLDASEASELSDLRTKRLRSERTQSESARDRTLRGESADDRAETISAARSKLEKVAKTSDSDDRSGRADRRIEVRDLRTERGHERSNGDTGDGGDGRRGTGEAAGRSDPSSTVEARDSQPTADRSSQFETLRAEGGPTSAASRGSESSSRAMNGGTAANLRQTLQESLNAEIVRSARLVVRGNGRGEIRLNLRPDSLGNVRISLQMQDGHIAGRIIVDNQSVREVFEQNLASLQKAFEESGLEAGGVEISLADSGNQPDQSTDEAPHHASVRDAADRFGYSVPDLSTIEEYHDLVDVVV